MLPIQMLLNTLARTRNFLHMATYVMNFTDHLQLIELITASIKQIAHVYAPIGEFTHWSRSGREGQSRKNYMTDTRRHWPGLWRYRLHLQYIEVTYIGVSQRWAVCGWKGIHSTRNVVGGNKLSVSLH
jgi:hypothetical protein